jgi:hypothetical protein
MDWNKANEMERYEANEMDRSEANKQMTYWTENGNSRTPIFLHFNFL